MDKIHRSLLELIPVVDAIQATIGPYCETVLHDFAHPENSLVYMAGNVTSRQIGAPLTDFVLAMFYKQGDNCENVINYTTTSPAGKTLRSSTIFIRNPENKVVGCLCINIDITPMIMWKHFVDTNLAVNSVPVEENFTNDVAEVLSTMIKNALAQYQIPAINLPKEDKLSIVSHLDEKGVFLIKGAIEQVAGAIGVSRYSIYNYLDEVRSTKNGK